MADVDSARYQVVGQRSPTGFLAAYCAGSIPSGKGLFRPGFLSASRRIIKINYMIYRMSVLSDFLNDQNAKGKFIPKATAKKIIDLILNLLKISLITDAPS